jgi:hypothetical protein
MGNNTSGMSRDEIFNAIQEGIVTLAEFDAWLDDIINDAKDSGYQEGRIDGEIYGGADA